jgi:hypothetical protein
MTDHDNLYQYRNDTSGNDLLIIASSAYEAREAIAKVYSDVDNWKIVTIFHQTAPGIFLMGK